MSETNVPRILVVDDQPRNLDALEALLAPMNCTTVRAQSADEALLCLLEDDFAAIILDIRMPDMSGIELAKLIKERKRTKDVPILFLTAHMLDETDALQGYGVGAVDYLSKPINPDILRSKVGVFIDLFTANRALNELNEALQAEVAEREKAQEALRLANQELEHRVQERTAALRHAHQGVRENAERLRMAMHVAQIGAWEWQLASGQMAWSTDPEALFGFPKASLGADLRMFRRLHPEDKEVVERAIDRVRETGSYEADYRIVRPDESLVWVTERGRVVADAGGNPTRVVGISRNVTREREAARERERLLQEARRASEEAEHQSRLKDDFLVTLSHELRTPMNVILGWLTILRRRNPPRDVSSAIAVIRRNAEHQAQLIEDLLDMTRLMAGAVQLDMKDVDVAALVEGTVQGLQPAATDKHVRLVASVEPGIGEIPGDAKRLQQVLRNLVQNGVKFTSSGGHVEIRAWRVDGCLRIAVRDNGQGIEPEFLPHVFDRFRHQGLSIASQAYGLGLGLSIAKHLIELHGGSIEASSPGVGQGALFTVEVPAGVPATAPMGGSSERRGLASP